VTPTAPRYLTRFRCLADTCEDTCCAGLVVLIGDERWKHLRTLVAGNPEDAAHVAAHIQPDPDTAGAGKLSKREDGHCSFLDAQRLCSLHRKYGEAALPDACAAFPRSATVWNGRMEVAGSLACPEVARLCLLAEDALEPEPVTEAFAVRPELARRLGGDAEDPWMFHAGAVRTAAVGLLQRRELPFATRLYLLGHLALRLDGFYYRGTDAFFGDSREGVEALLAEILQSLEAPDTLAELHRGFAALELPGGPWAGICTAALRARLGSVRGPRFPTLVGAVLASYGGEDAAPDAAWAVHAARRERLEPVLGARLEQYFRHHAVNYWLRHSFTGAPRLLDYVFQLALRAAVLRWTLLGHPAVVALCEKGPGLEDAAALDAAAVECFQLIAKHVEQAPELHALAQGLMGGGGAETLGRMLVLLKGL
jgi:lysine-N-methylase